MKETEDLFHVPKIKRRIRAWKFQWVGFSILFLIPILALIGVFGESTQRINESYQGVEISIKYPDIFRYGQSQTLKINVSNQSNQDLNDVKVTLPRDYLNKFTSVSFVPSVEHAFRVSLGHIMRGSTRMVLVNLTAEDYGYHHGRISISNEGQDLMSSEVKTLVFP